MLLTTPVNIKPCSRSISHADRVLMLGSCFTDNVGKHMLDGGLDCIVNPFGPLYNPCSVLSALEKRDAEFYDWIQQGIDVEAARKIDFSGRNILIVTFGTAWIYRLKETGHVVANCRKADERLFVRERLDIRQIVEQWSRFIRQSCLDCQSSLKSQCPNDSTSLSDNNQPAGLCRGLHFEQIIFTVSPIRHKKDGMHENQLSKATLLLAIDELCKAFPDQCTYFPSYEIMLDELRDYRFYADDMLHPSGLAVEYIWQRFRQTFFVKQTDSYVSQFEALNRTLAHRPSNPDSTEYRTLISNTIEKLETLKCTTRSAT